MEQLPPPPQQEYKIVTTRYSPVTGLLTFSMTVTGSFSISLPAILARIPVRVATPIPEPLAPETVIPPAPAPANPFDMEGYQQYEEVAREVFQAPAQPGPVSPKEPIEEPSAYFLEDPELWFDPTNLPKMTYLSDSDVSDSVVEALEKNDEASSNQGKEDTSEDEDPMEDED